MDIALIVTIVAGAIGATWTLAWKIGDGTRRLEDAFRTHAAEDAASFKEIKDNVVQLKARNKTRGRS